MIVRAAELVLDFWIFGGPVVAMVWALLCLTDRVPARARYVIAIAGFVAAIVLPVIAFTPRGEEGATSISASPGDSTVAALARPVAIPLAVAWPFGSLLLLAREAIAHRRARCSALRHHPAPASMRIALGRIDDARLFTSDGCAPSTVGMMRPRIVLPEDLLAHVSIPTARRIVAHEQSHCAWRDPFVFALLRFLAALFWIAPVWPCLAWARREREAAADEAACDRVEADAYVAALLAFARTGREHALPIAGSDLEFRVRRLLALPGRRPLVVAAMVFAAAGLLLSIAGPADLTVPQIARKQAAVVASSPVFSRPEAPAPPARRSPNRVAPPEPVQRLPIAGTFSIMSAPGSATENVHRDVAIDRHDDVDIDRHVSEASPVVVALPEVDRRQIRNVIRIRSGASP